MKRLVRIVIPNIPFGNIRHRLYVFTNLRHDGIKRIVRNIRTPAHGEIDRETATRFLLEIVARFNQLLLIFVRTHVFEERLRLLRILAVRVDDETVNRGVGRGNSAVIILRQRRDSIIDAFAVIIGVLPKTVDQHDDLLIAERRGNVVVHVVAAGKNKPLRL